MNLDTQLNINNIIVLIVHFREFIHLKLYIYTTYIWSIIIGNLYSFPFFDVSIRDFVGIGKGGLIVKIMFSIGKGHQFLTIEHTHFDIYY
jgi:hypothetical protein